MDRTSTTWSNKDELAYLDEIGESHEKWKELSPYQRIQKKIKLLKGYLAGTERRVNWQSIKKESVVEKANSLLEKLIGK